MVLKPEIGTFISTYMIENLKRRLNTVPDPVKSGKTTFLFLMSIQAWARRVLPISRKELTEFHGP